MLQQGSSSLVMAFAGGLRRQPCSVSCCGAAPLWTPGLGGFFAKCSSQSVAFAPHRPCDPGWSPWLATSPSLPQPMLQIPGVHRHILGQVSLAQLCHSALGGKYPPFSGAVPGGSEFNPLLQKNPGYISNVFHFPLRHRPRSPQQFSAVKLFHAFHLFASSLPKAFLSFEFFKSPHHPPSQMIKSAVPFTSLLSLEQRFFSPFFFSGII